MSIQKKYGATGQVRRDAGSRGDAFTLDRCMWGTDWTRAVNLLTYKDGVDSFKAADWLSDGDRAKLMGGSLEKIYGWSPRKT